MLIRKADITDIMDIYQWRNDRHSRSMFLNTSAVSLPEHTKWFETALKENSILVFIGINGAGKIGITRFDLNVNTNSSEVSINLNPEMRGKNMSFDFLSSSIMIYKKDHLVKLTATIKHENKASLRIFGKCGFLKIAEDNIFQYLSIE